MVPTAGRRNCYRYFTVTEANEIAFIFDLACVLYIVREILQENITQDCFTAGSKSSRAQTAAELGLRTRAPVFVTSLVQ